jgi:thiol:disulfide interchange protein
MQSLPFLRPLATRLPLLALLVALAAVPVAHADTAPTPPFDPTRDAFSDVSAAEAQARAEGKRVLVDVGGEWCSWCHLLDRFFRTDDEARAVRDANYVVVKVNYSPENRNTNFLVKYPPVAGYPHIFILDANGKLVQSQDTGQLEQGDGYSRDKILAFLKQYAPPGKVGAVERARTGT